MGSWSAKLANQLSNQANAEDDGSFFVNDNDIEPDIDYDDNDSDCEVSFATTDEDDGAEASFDVDVDVDVDDDDDDDDDDDADSRPLYLRPQPEFTTEAKRLDLRLLHNSDNERIRPC